MQPDSQQDSRFRSPIAASTRAFIRAAQNTEAYSVWDFIHGYIYARWPYLYIGIGVGEHPLARAYAKVRVWFASWLPGDVGEGSNGGSMADTYHGKVVTTESARALLNIREPVKFKNLEQIIPFPVAKDIIAIDPDHLVALHCPCRSVREDPCGPLDVCLIVGEPIASFVMEHHPERARWIGEEEGIDILEAEAERGHVHHAFFKDAMLGRFYAICNCCACCCGAMQLMRNGTPMLISSGYVSVRDANLCTDCGLCEEMCQFDAIRFDLDEPEIIFEVCMGCGVCCRHCPEDALTLVADPAKGVPLEMRELLAGAGYIP